MSGISDNGQLLLSPGGAYQWTVVRAWRYAMAGQDVHIIVPAGFQSDLASVPRLFWAIVPPYGKHLEASIMHDYLCYSGWSRAKADREFLHAMKRAGVKRWRRMVMFWAVRAWAIATGKG